MAIIGLSKKHLANRSKTKLKNPPRLFNSGGKNAIIIMDDADIDNAVDGSLWGAFGTSGQRCTASSRLIVHKKVYRKFCEKLVERVKKLRVGNGLNAKTEVLDIFSEWKALYIDYSGKLQKAQIDQVEV